MISSILDIIDKYDAVSFDVFDTLLLRDGVTPESVFVNVEKRLKENAIYSGEFARQRVQAQENAQSAGRIEATWDDIYELIVINTDKNVIKQVELEEEIKSLKPNLFLRDLCQKLKNINKKIYIISDMYLPTEAIKNFLDINGFTYDDIFVSSEYQARKSRGTLFKVVLSKTGLMAKQLLHIGDNSWSDCVIPNLIGIKAIQWKPELSLNAHSKVYLEHGATGKEIYNFLLNKSVSTDNYFKIGFELFGPLLMGFCSWIHYMNSMDGNDSVCFLSRDGHIVKAAYELIYPGSYSYILASRRSLTVPRLINAESFEDIINTVPYIKRNESIKDLLYKIGIEDDCVIQLAEEKIGKDIARSELISEKGQLLYSLISPYMKENAHKELKACKEFLKNNFNGRKVGLVDIGWYGTMQKMIESISASHGIDRQFTGYYLGFIKKENVNESLNAKGYIYDFHCNNKYNPKLIFGFNGLIELMFTANHGSAKKYVLDCDTSVCILEDNKGEYSEFVEKVQSGALEFIKQWVADNKSIIDNPIATFSALHDLLSNPNKNDCQELGDLLFFDAYFEKLIQYPGIKSAFLNPKATLKGFLRSNWKIGYIKKAIPFINPATGYRIINSFK